jgi:PAS domain S-box-containing protein
MSSINFQGDRRQKDFYRIFFDVSPDIIIVVDKTTNLIKDVNQKAIELFKFSYGEFIDKNFSELNLVLADTDTFNHGVYNFNPDSIYYYYVNTPLKLTQKNINFEQESLIIYTIKNLTETFYKHQLIKELKVSELRYKAIVDNQLEFLYRCDVNLNVIFINKSFCTHLGNFCKNIIGSKLFSDDDTEHSKLIKDAISNISFESQFAHYDYKVIELNKEIKYIHWSIHAIFNEQKEIIEYQGVGFDITERKNLENELIASRDRYIGILDNLHDGFYETDVDGRITFASRSALEILGYTSFQEVNKLYIRDHFVDPTIREQMLIRLINAGDKISEQEMQAYTKNHQEKTLSVNSQLTYDDNHTIVGTKGTFRDITLQKQNMNELIRIYHMVEESQNALVLMIPDGTIVYTNKKFREISGLNSNDSVIDKKIKQYICFDSPETCGSILEKVCSTEKWIGPAYAFCFSKEHRRVPIDVVFSKIKNGGGKYYIVASYYDVSDYKELEEKIKIQSNLYEELLVDMRELVEQMDEVNLVSSKKISLLEEAFVKSIKDIASV